MQLLPQIDGDGLLIGFKEVYVYKFDPNTSQPNGLLLPFRGNTKNLKPASNVIVQQYGVPADCIEVPLPVYAEDDDVFFTQGAWIVRTGAKRIRAYERVKQDVLRQFVSARAFALNALSGISGRAARAGNALLAEQSDTLAQALLDLKQSPTIAQAQSELQLRTAIDALLESFLIDAPAALVRAVTDAGLFVRISS